MRSLKGRVGTEAAPVSGETSHVVARAGLHTEPARAGRCLPGAPGRRL